MPVLKWQSRLSAVTVNMWYDAITDPMYQKSVLVRWFIRMKPYLIKSLCCILLYPLLLLAILSRLMFFFIRWLVFGILRLRYGEITLMTGQETLFAQDAPWAGILTRCLIIQGKLNLPEIRKFIMENWVNAKTEDGNFRYPSFHQFMHYELGYFIWRKDLMFSVEDHIFVCPYKAPETGKELQERIGTYRNQLMPAETAAWRIVLIPLSKEYEHLSSADPHYCVLIMIDHTMGDGISIANMILTHLADQKTVTRHAAPDQSRLTFLQNPKNFAKFLFDVPQILLKELSTRDHNALYGPRLNGSSLFGISRPIDFQVIRRIRKITGATVNDILLSCLAGVIRTHFNANNFAIPKQMNTLIPVSMHSVQEGTKMSNEFSFICCELPINGNSPMERLMLCKKASTKAKDPSIIWFNYICLKYAVNYYPYLFTRVFMHRNCTWLVSNVPFAEQPISLWGGHLLQEYAGLLSSQERIGCGMIFVTYNGQLQVGINIDKVFTNKMEDIDSLLSNFEKAVTDLDNSIKVI